MIDTNTGISMSVDGQVHGAANSPTVSAGWVLYCLRMNFNNQSYINIKDWHPIYKYFIEVISHA